MMSVILWAKKRSIWNVWQFSGEMTVFTPVGNLNLNYLFLLVFFRCTHTNTHTHTCSNIRFCSSFPFAPFVAVCLCVYVFPSLFLCFDSTSPYLLLPRQPTFFSETKPSFFTLSRRLIKNEWLKAIFRFGYDVAWLSSLLGKFVSIWKQLQTVAIAGSMARLRLIIQWLVCLHCFKWPLSKVGWTLCMMQSILLMLTNSRDTRRLCGIIFSSSFSSFLAHSSHSTCS